MQDIIILGGIVLMAYLYFKRKKGIGQELIIAFLISFAWISYSGLYCYKDVNYVLYGINIFALVAWTGGLVILREVYESIKGKNRMLKASIFYIVTILILEYIGYNVWGIQIAANYPGLFGLELMHVPPFAQIYYLAIGPAYLWLTDYLKVK